MNSCYFLISFLWVITICLAQNEKPNQNNLSAVIEQIICNNKTQFTEEQCGAVNTNCPSYQQSLFDESTKSCLKLTKLTECQRLTAWCGPQRKCIVDRYMDKIGNKTNAEEMNKKLEQEIICLRKELKIK